MINRARAERIIARDSWFVRQPARLRQALLARAQITSVEAGQWIYGTGDALNGLYGVVTGSAHLMLATGDTDVLIEIVQAGQLFGQAAGFGGGPRLVTAIAGEHSTLLHVPDHALVEIARSEAGIWRGFTELLYNQLASALALAGAMIHLPPPARVAARLIMLSAAHSPIRVTQAQLAELTGLSRKTVNLHLRALEAEGIISLAYRGVAVKDRARLRARARL